MELKFERLAQPFMLLHVNRCHKECSCAEPLSAHAAYMPAQSMLSAEHAILFSLCLHRYAGRGFESEDQLEKGGTLLIKVGCTS